MIITKNINKHRVRVISYSWSRPIATLDGRTIYVAIIKSRGVCGYIWIIEDEMGSAVDYVECDTPTVCHMLLGLGIQYASEMTEGEYDFT